MDQQGAYLLVFPVLGTVIFSILFCSSKFTQTDAWKYWPEEVNSLKRTRVSNNACYILLAVK